MKRILIVVPSIFAVLLVLLLVGPSFVDWSRYKEPALEQIKKATGYEAELTGELELALLPSPHVVVEGLQIKAPEGSTSDYIASLKRLDINVSFMPLLRGEIAVNSVRLIEPELYLEVLKSGRPNWMSKEIQKKTAAKKEEKAGVPSENKLARAVSLQKVMIEGGAFHFQDHKKGSSISISGIDTSLRAETLEGPYKLDGKLSYGDYNIEFEGGAGRYSADTKSIVPKVKASISPGDVVFEYSGVLSFDDGFEIQGETGISMVSLAETLADFGVKASDTLDVPLSSKGLLTASQERFSYKDLNLKLGQGEYSGEITSSFAPLNIKTKLSAETQPELGIWLPSTLEADINLLSQPNKITLNSSTIELDSTGFIVSGSYAQGARPKAELALSTKKLDWGSWQNKIAPKTQQSNGQSAAENSSDDGSAVAGIGRGLTLPFDLDFDFDIQNVRAQGKDISGLRAKGALHKNSLVLDRLAVNDFAGSSFFVKGQVADLQQLSGIDLNFTGKSSDIKALAKTLGFEELNLPPKLNKAEALAAFKGSSKKLDMTSNIKALNGEFITQGSLQDPMGSLRLDNMSFQVKHRNMAEFIQAFNPGYKRSKSFEKPLDFYAAMSRDGSLYKFKDVIGNFAGTALAGGFDVETGKEKPVIKGNLQLGDLVIDAPAKKAASKSTSVSAPSSAGKSDSNADIRWSREAINTEWMHMVGGELDVVAKSITYGKWGLKSPVLKVSLNDGALEVSKLDAGLFDGQLTMSASIKSSENPRQPIHLETSSQLRNVSLEPLVLALVGNKVVKGKGRVSMDADLRAAGISPAALIYDMQGKGSATGQNLVLEGFDLTRFAEALSDDAKLGHSAEQIWGGTTKGGSTAFDALEGNFTMNEGIIQVSKLNLDGPSAFVAAKGSINLPRWWVDMPAEITMKPPYDVPPYTIPIKGPLDNPKGITSNILQDFFARKIERKATKELSKILGKVLDIPQEQPQQPEQVSPSGGEPEAPAQQPQQQEPKPEDILRGVLEGLIQ